MLRSVSIFFISFCMVHGGSTEKQFSKSIRNKDFDGQKLFETEISRTPMASVNLCTAYCAAEPACRSFNYNRLSRICVIFDRDFIDVGLTDTLPEDGWLYYYLGRDDTRDLSARCVSTIPTGVCSLFCLHYIYDAVASYTDFASMCSQMDGGEMVKVDGKLKQHCIENLLADQTDGDIIIQGTKDPLTGTWKYDDGTNITFFNWDTTNGQPDATVFTDQPRIALRRTTDYKWHDISGTLQRGVVCQQH